MNIFFKRARKSKTLREEELRLELPSGLVVDARLMLSSARKTAVIQIKKGEVVVRAPLKGSRQWLLDFLSNKASWIDKTLSEGRHIYDAPQKTFAAGDEFELLGKAFPLRYEEGRPMMAAFEGDHLLVRVRKGLSADDRAKRAASLIEAHYRMVAVAHFKQRSEHFSTLLARPARDVRVREYKSRWGCCAADGTITYCWRAIMAPEHVVDYLVAHEMSHLVHMNHSKQFWDQVERLFPDYKNARRWLKENGHRLNIDR